ncbi:MAG: 5-(carboxyamino)imidazole ribonucleotide synthase [Alphaproteobacteria bacterium]|nr:5-(carboxyamino)imidazole ribonucleotide synthase [Alphaproteobacteria bacterium]
MAERIVPAGGTKGSTRIVPPGGTIGIVGGGQLGRMTALAAARLGYRCHVFCPEPANPTSLVAAAATVAAYDDQPALEAFASAVDVVTFEFENLPRPSFDVLERLVPVRPRPAVLETSQDREQEKFLVVGQGIATAPFAVVRTADDVEPALARVGVPAVLKTARLGYDGKGQAMVRTPGEALEAFARLGGVRCVVERFVDFACEVSVIVARGLDGAIAPYDTVENRHKHHILATTTAPARIGAASAREAQAIARRLAEALDLVGLLAVEMFVARDGRVLVNELAPRPHNSAHWTIEACVTSQFEQFVRAVCGLPLGDPSRRFDAVMTNLIGHDVDAWPALIAEPGAHLHLYGKTETRPGRKMGHVTRLYPRT